MPLPVPLPVRLPMRLSVPRQARPLATAITTTALALALAATALATGAAPLPAQQALVTADTAVGWRPLARFASVGLGVPQQLSASVIVGLQREWGAGTRQTTQVWYVRIEPGLTATKAALGVGLWRFADQGGGATLQVAALRTYGTPWEAVANQTYVGAEIRTFVWLTGPWVGYYERQGAAAAGPRNFFSFGLSFGF